MPAVLALVAFFAVSCGRPERQAGHLYLRLSSDPTTLDPARITDVAGGRIAAKLFNGLVRLGDDMSVIPDISERWDVSPDAREYTFHLRRGVRFSNGREVVSGDFVYSFLRVLSPKGGSPNTWVLDRISGAREYMKGEAQTVTGLFSPSEYVLKIRLDRPFPPFLKLLTMPAAYVVPAEETGIRGAGFSSDPVGTGPFILRRWKHNDSLVLESNKAYFAPGAKVSGIVYRIIPEDLTAVAEFETGGLDLLDLPSTEYSSFIRSSRWRDRISSSSSANTYYLGLNCTKPPFDRVEVRRAAAYALDRKMILSSFYEGKGRLALGPVADVLRKWPAPKFLDYDPGKAAETVRITGAGKTDIDFYVNSDQDGSDMAEIIQSYLRKAGFRVNIRRLEWSAYKAALSRGDAGMFWMSWWADYPDPENFLFPVFHSSNTGAGGNRSRYANRRFDALLEEGITSGSGSARNLYYREAEEIVSEESPWIPFFHRTDFIAAGPAIKYFRTYPVYTMDKGTEVSF